MNKFLCMGRLTGEPETSTSQNGTVFSHFSIAVDRKYKREGEPEADFFACTTFGKQAEFVQKYLHKGTKVLIAGRMENDEWTNRDGQKVKTTKIKVEEIEFAESKKAESNTETKDDYLNVTNDVELPF